MKHIISLLIILTMTTCHAGQSMASESIKFTTDDGCVIYRADVFGSNTTSTSVLNVACLSLHESSILSTLYPGKKYKTDEDTLLDDGTRYSRYSRGTAITNLYDVTVNYSTDQSMALNEFVPIYQEIFHRNTHPAKDMDFTSVNGAIELAMKIPTSLGMNCSVQGVFSIDRAIYDEYYRITVDRNDEQSDPKPTRYPWATEGISYLVFLQQEFDNIPIFQYRYYHPANDMAVAGTSIEVGIGADGLQFFLMNNAVQLLSKESSCNIMPFYRAVELFSESRNMILVDNPEQYYITRISLEYIATDWPEQSGIPYQLRPAWVFEQWKQDDIENPYEVSVKHYIVDAIDGTVIE